MKPLFFAVMFANFLSIPARANEVIEPCLFKIVHSIKRDFLRVTPDEKQVSSISRVFLENSARFQISVELLVAIAVVESSLNPKTNNTFNDVKRVKGPFDGGLMGIRCVPGKVPAYCQNLRLPRAKAFQLNVNVELAARYLRALQDKPVYLRVRGKRVRCLHKGHSPVAHYNWGNRVILRGYASEYANRVALLANHIAASTGNKSIPELANVRTKLRYNAPNWRLFQQRVPKNICDTAVAVY